MTERAVDEWSITKVDQNEYLEIWIDNFLKDRKIEGYTPGTLYFYKTKLALLSAFCQSQSITSLKQIDANTIRNLLFWLESTGHNPGGRHAVYRATKTLIRWWSTETEPEGWKNPFKNLKAPKVGMDPIDPVESETVKKLIAACNNGKMTDKRDKAIFLFLLDTGVRAAELLSIGRVDIDLVTGFAMIRHGKGRKPRTVFIGKEVKKAIKAYLKTRSDTNPALWVNDEFEELKYPALLDMFDRRVKKSMVPHTTPHDFRRAFALGMLRNGVDIYTLQKLMGHADLQVLRRYLAQTDNDLAAAHRRAGLADRL